MRLRMEGRVNETNLGSWIRIHQLSRVLMLHLNSWIRWRCTPLFIEENETHTHTEKREKCFFLKSENYSNAKNFVQICSLPIYSQLTNLALH